MVYQVVLTREPEGVTASVPALPGCWSEGDTDDEALANVRDAIREYLAALADRYRGADVREVEVEAQPVPRIPGISHLDAIRALEKAGFVIVRQGKHVVMSDGTRMVTIPRHKPIKPFTMGGIARDAGLTPEAFRKLL